MRGAAVSEQDRAISPRESAVARAAAVQAIAVAGAAPLASECAVGIGLAARAPEADVTDALVRRATRAARGTTHAVARARLPGGPHVARAAELTVPAVVARRARACAVEALAVGRAASGAVDTGAPCAIVAAVPGAAAARATWTHRVVGSGTCGYNPAPQPKGVPLVQWCNWCNGATMVQSVQLVHRCKFDTLVPRQAPEQTPRG